MAQKKKNAKGAHVGMGVGITAALLGAAGAYFLYGSTQAEKHRTMVKSWTLKAKAEVLEGLEKARNMSHDEYDQLVDKTLKTYSKLRGASASEIASFAREMKAHWKKIEKKGSAEVAESKKVAGKVVRTAKKKAVKIARGAKKMVEHTIG